MAIFKSERDKVLVLVIIAAVASVYAFYPFRWTPVNESLQVAQAHVDSLDAWNRKAQNEMSKNSEKALLQQAARSAQSLQVMRELVPTGNEVPTLLEQVSTAARRVGLDVSDIQPQPVTPGDQLRIEVVPLRKGGAVWKFKGQALVDGFVVCEAEFLATLADKVAKPDGSDPTIREA